MCDESKETCHFCGVVETTDAAVEAGWIPYFYRGQIEISEPACVACTGKYLILAEDGEFQVRPPSEQALAMAQSHDIGEVSK